MIFRQLFEPISSPYTYLLGCEQTGQALLIDPVLPMWQRDLSLIHDLGLKLMYTLDTHIHADHVTAALRLKRETGSQIACPAVDQLPCADVGLVEGVPLYMGAVQVDPLFTPGHTDGHHAFLVDARIFTGDALLIDGCGRTDFQNGSSQDLFHSVRGKLFTLPEDTLVYPGHDYHERRVSNIGQEKNRNPRLGANKSLAEFVDLMTHLKLAYPKFIDYAVPSNQQCGLCAQDVPEDLQQYCDQMAASVQG